MSVAVSEILDTRSRTAWTFAWTVLASSASTQVAMVRARRGRARLA